MILFKKNLLSISYDEKIPHIISNQKKYSAFEEKILVNKLFDSCACNEDKAKELIYLWEYAYSVVLFSDILSRFDNINEILEQLSELHESLKCNLIEILELGENKYKLLYDNNIDTLRDLVCISKSELLSIKGIGKKTCGKIDKRLYEFVGFRLKDEPNQHFDMFYTDFLKRLSEKKGDNWEYHFYICAML